MIMEEKGKLLICRGVVLSVIVCVCGMGVADTEKKSPLDEIYAQLELSSGEKQILSTVSDGTSGSEEIGFYMMMGKVALLAKLRGDDFDELEAPGYKNLMRTPGRFRCRPLRMPVRIYTVAKLTVKNRRITPHRQYWPIKKPIWEILCTTSGKTPDVQRNQPLILYSTVIPDGLLNEGKKRGDDDVWDFTKGPTFDFAGVFYKIVRKEDTATKTPRDYPVFLAWQIEKKTIVIGHWPTNAIPAALIALGLFTGVIVFVKLRSRIKREKKESKIETTFKNYKPLRDSDDDMSDINTDDKAVDPELTRAVREYRKQHGIDDR